MLLLFTLLKLNHFSQVTDTFAATVCEYYGQSTISTFTHWLVQVDKVHFRQWLCVCKVRFHNSLVLPSLPHAFENR